MVREGIEVDILERGKLSVRTSRDYISLTQNAQLSLMKEDIQSAAQLAVWLDKHIPHRDLDGPQVQEWLLKLLTFLVEKRNMPLEKLARERVRLKNAVAQKIKECRTRAEKCISTNKSGRSTANKNCAPGI